MTGRRARPARSKVAIASAALAAALIAVLVAALVAGGGGTAGDDAVAATAPPRTARVTRRDLARTATVEGTFGYAGRRTVHGGGGVITGLPRPGDTLVAGDALFEVDGHAGPIVLSGARPMWRTVAGGVSAGADIGQIEGNLAYMGFAAGGLVVDDRFTSATRLAIERFQRAHGLAPTGELGPGDVWFSPEPVRVAGLPLALGDPADGPVLEVSSATQVVTTSLEPDQLRHVDQGDAAGLALPDGTTATGTISEIAATATVTPGDDGAAATTTIGATVTPDRPLEIVDGSGVVVELVIGAASGVLAVPVDAVVATAHGSLAVEVVAGGGAGRLVEITTGATAEGWVEITGDVAEGTAVVSA